jgi:CRISPR-associated endonuclease/helicase Cas3
VRNDEASTELSGAARSVWAKTSRDPDTHEVVGWMPLWQHLDDTAAVAGRLWDDWLPMSVRRQIADCIGGDERRARRLACWLAGVHDVGKASPAFAVQYSDGAHRMASAGLRTARSAWGPERRKLRHELAGHICLVRWLAARHGWRRSDADLLAVVVGGHHGVAPYGLQACGPAIVLKRRTTQPERGDRAVVAGRGLSVPAHHRRPCAPTAPCCAR